MRRGDRRSGHGNGRKENSMAKGIIVKAYRPISKTTIVDIGNKPDKGAATFYGATKKHFGIKQGFDDYDVTFDVYGKGFDYRFAPVPTSGTVKKVVVRIDGELVLVVDKLKLPVKKALKLYQANDPFGAFSKLLKGDDKIYGSKENDPQIWGGKGKDKLWGNHGNDTLDGFKGNDVNDGGPGNDFLIDTRGKDVFQFSSPFKTGEDNRAFNFDTIKNFGKGDRIFLDPAFFGAAGKKVEKGELHFGPQAQDSNDFFLWDANSRTFFYDPDGNGPIARTPIFETLNDAKITHKAIAIGVLFDT